MYEERREGISIKAIILQILIVVLFVLLLMWLFPLKNNSVVLSDSKTGTVIVERVFNANITAMKDSAKDYFTNERLPKNIGDKVTITLGEMLDKKIILPFVDKDGNQCDRTASYVQVERTENEYEMKINLKCSSQEDYLIVNLGCYNYCSDTCDPKKPTTPTPTTTTKTTKKYQYKCTTDGGWSDWSNWQEEQVTSTSTKQVETKVEKVTYTEKEEQVVGTTTKTVPTSVKKTKTIKVWEYDTFDYSKSGWTCASKTVPLDCGNGCYKYKVVYNCKRQVNKTETYYETVNKKVTTDVKQMVDVTKTKEVNYYRFRTKTDGSEYLKWSTSKKDTSLLNKGCTLTGKTQTTTKKVTK